MTSYDELVRYSGERQAFGIWLNAEDEVEGRRGQGYTVCIYLLPECKHQAVL